jgi:hypothetical protein
MGLVSFKQATRGGITNNARQNTQTLAKNRQGDIDKIISLFDNFGVSAKRDIDEQTQSLQARTQTDAISRGIQNTTLVQPQLGQIASGS